MTENNQPTIASDPLDSLLAYYERANFALRIALLIVVLWPLSALAAAMLLHGSRAQTFVPLVDMLPLAAVFFVILGSPFGLAVLWKYNLAKKGFLFLIGLIGVELTIGVYLTVIPVSSDNGLVPLLLLSSMALLLLWISKFAQPVRILLTLVLIVITIVFIAGGRPNFSSTLRMAFTQRVRHDFYTMDFPSMTIPVASDLWTQEVTLPHAWTTFNVTINRNFDDPSPESAWFAFRCSGASGQLIDAGTVYKAGQPYSGGLFALCSGPIQLRGHADILFERVGTTTTLPMPRPQASVAPSSLSLATTAHADPPPAAGNTQPIDAPVASVTQPIPKPLAPDWASAQHASHSEIAVDVAPCILRGTDLECWFRVTNEGDEQEYQVLNGQWKSASRIIDGGGAEHLATKVRLGSSPDRGRPKIILPTGIPVLGSVSFENITNGQIKLLEIYIGQDFWGRSMVAFHDIPVVREEK